MQVKVKTKRKNRWKGVVKSEVDQIMSETGCSKTRAKNISKRNNTK